MKICVLFCILFSCFSQIYTMELAKKHDSVSKIPSLVYLASKKTWQNHERFTTLQQETINWGKVNPAVRLLILSHCEVAPDTVMKILNSGKDHFTSNFIEKFSCKIKALDPLAMLKVIERKPFPLEENDPKRLIMTTILSDGYGDAMNEYLPSVLGYDFVLPVGLHNASNVQAECDDFVLKGLDNGCLTLINKSNGEEKELRGHAGVIKVIKFHNKGSCAVSGDSVGNVWVWDMSNGDGRKIGQHMGPVCGITCKESLVATYGTDKIVRLYNLRTGAVIKMRGEKRHITGVQFHDTESQLIIHFSNSLILKKYSSAYLNNLTPEKMIIVAAVKRLKNSNAPQTRDIECVQAALNFYKFKLPRSLKHYFEAQVSSFMLQEEKDTF